MKKLILIFFITKAMGQISLGDGNRRYLHSHDINRYLVAKFNFSAETGFSEKDSCFRLDYNSHISLGTMFPLEQIRFADKPSEAYVKWYMQCLEFMVSKIELDIKNDGYQIWGHQSHKQKQGLIVTLIEKYIGPEFVLEELGYLGENSFIVGKPKTIIEFADLMLALPINQMASKQSNVLQVARQNIIYLLSIGDNLVN